MFERRTGSAFRESRFLSLTCLISVLSAVGCATGQSTPITPSEVVRGGDGAYSLLLMTSGWTRVPTQTSDLDSDLILSNAKTGVTVIVYVHTLAERSIDGVVSARREVLAERNEILSFEEERSFLEESAFVPVSVARYRLRRDSGWFALIVGTAAGPDSIVEILTLGGQSQQVSGLFDDVIAGLRIPAALDKAP